METETGRARRSSALPLAQPHARVRIELAKIDRRAAPHICGGAVR